MKFHCHYRGKPLYINLSSNNEFDFNVSNILLFFTCRAKLYDLAVALLPGLDTVEVNVLFDAVKPALKVS